ncbi:MAG: PKD domain-containing protein, partial [Methanospirillum sp.]|nr:PKD domain-containing protein [Methanospirillum sp.]
FQAVALLLLFVLVCTAVGAVKIQTERQYTENAVKPNSSPALVGTAAFKNSLTDAVSKPYKTNSWVSPILWADSHTLIYPDNGAITNGDRHPLYQLPVYPLPWSLYYSKTTTEEANRFRPLNYVDPNDDNSTIPEGLAVRPMPVFPLYDTQQFTPTGGHDTTQRKYDMYALSGQYSSPSIQVDPGFNASHIKIDRMGDYDAGFLLSVSDDPDRPSGIDTTAAMQIDTVRGSPFIHFTTTKISTLNLTIWHGHGLTRTSGSLTLAGKEIGYEILTTPMKSVSVPAPQTDYDHNTYWENQTVIIFYPKNPATYSQTDLDPVSSRITSNWLFDRTRITISNLSSPGYVTLASVSSPSVIDNSLLQTLAGAAFQYPVGSTVTYQYAEQSGTVQATYALKTSDLLQTGGTPVQGLLPLHYGSFFGKGTVLSTTGSFVTNGSGTEITQDSILGEIKLLKGQTYTCTYQYPGILPYIPQLPEQDATGRLVLSKWLDNVKQEFGEGGWVTYPYTGMDLDIGKDTYNGGKKIWSASNLYRTAEGLKPSMAADAADSVQRSLGLFFRDTPTVMTINKSNGQAPYYSYYDPNASTIVLYPAATAVSWPPNDERYLQWDGYGTATKLNDHHYTWGYYINAAAEVAFDNESWMQEYKNVINQLVFDVAYDSSISESAMFSYPHERLWDPYTGHCEASGMTYTDVAGNSDESISEELQFWAGVIRWGAASGQTDIEKLGIIHYTQAVYSYYTFWRDYFGNYQKLWNKISTATGKTVDPNWMSSSYVPQVWDGKIKQSTFFGTHPAGETVITALPMTGSSYYQAIDKSWINSTVSAYDSYISTWNLDPLHPSGTVWQNGNSQWNAQLAYYGELACWYAVADPEKAFSSFFPLDPDTASVMNPTYNTTPQDQFTEGGKTTAEVYHFIRFLEDYGTPDPLHAHATNTPFSMIFVKDGIRTYVGYNPTSQPLTISFDDGTTISNVQPHEFGFWPSGMPGPIQASFTASPLKGNPPMQVTFADTSNGSITGRKWSFGDGNVSTAKNVSHTYYQNGNYSVTLTVTDVLNRTDSAEKTITVYASGTLPGDFSISTLQNGSGTMGLYPSLVMSNNTSYISYFSSAGKMPWTDKATGNIGVTTIDFNQYPKKIEGKQDAVPLVYNSYPAGVPQPDWGRSSVALSRDKTPLIAYIDLVNPYPQHLELAYKKADNTYGETFVIDNFPWNPSLAVASSKNISPTIGYPSVTGKNPNLAFEPDGGYTTPNWGAVNVEPIGNTTTFTPAIYFLNHLYTGTEETARMVYYNSTTREIRHSWNQNPTQSTWKSETVASGINAGWVSAAYYADQDTLGVCWYDLDKKTLRYTERALSGSSWKTPEQVDSSGHDAGSNCSLAYGPAAGAVPGPGISYYDATTRQLIFTFKDTGGWERKVVDSDGA